MVGLSFIEATIYFWNFNLVYVAKEILIVIFPYFDGGRVYIYIYRIKLRL